jgi:hypothetical protein
VRADDADLLERDDLEPDEAMADAEHGLSGDAER